MSEKEVQQEGDFKIKSKPKMKNLGKTNEPVKVNLSSKKEDVEEEVTKVELKQDDADKEQEATDLATDKPTEAVQEVVEEVSSGESPVQDEEPVTIQEITEEKEVEATTQQMSDAINESASTGKPLPENIEKLVSFMEETGGTVEDYVRLNADYSNVDNNTLLKEYYRKSKPHLNDDEINFLLEDKFS